MQKCKCPLVNFHMIRTLERHQLMCSINIFSGSLGLKAFHSSIFVFCVLIVKEKMFLMQCIMDNGHVRTACFKNVPNIGRFGQMGRMYCGVFGVFPVEFLVYTIFP